MTGTFQEHPHRRFNMLTGEWVLVSPHRTKRPWQGKKSPKQAAARPSYDPTCYLCPGNIRSNGEVNPEYKGVYSFTNDFSALLPDTGKLVFKDGLLEARTESGKCRVICFSPDHNKTLADLTVEEISKVVGLWQREYMELGADPNINHVQIFENKGAIMGCSNPHPHGQIWSQYSIPTEVQKRQDRQAEYWSVHSRGLLSDYLTQELELGTRIIDQNDHFVALMPFWAVWPYEMMILPKRKIASIDQLSEDEAGDFASMIRKVTRRYDQLFEVSFPYSSGIHQAPTDGQKHPEWHFHMSFYPPLLRSAEVKKFMVGYEMFADPQRDITVEQAAEKMRSLVVD